MPSLKFMRIIMWGGYGNEREQFDSLVILKIPDNNDIVDIIVNIIMDIVVYDTMESTGIYISMSSIKMSQNSFYDENMILLLG